MSEIVYNQDYKGIQGVNYPADGKMFYQQDFMNEQSDIGCEMIDRESDYFTPGVIEGFDVTISATAGCIDISAGIARDPLGRRIISSAIAARAVPDLQTTILAVSHVWTFEPYILDGTNEEKMRRKHSFLLGFYTEGNVPEKAVQLFEVERSGDTITLLEDLRDQTRMKEQFYDYIEQRVYDSYIQGLGKVDLVYNGKFSSTDVGLWSNGVNAHPDGWIYENPDGSVVSLSKDVDGSARVAVGTINTVYRFQQNIHEFPGWAKELQGKTVSALFNIKTASSTAKLKIYDGVNTVQQVISGAAAGKEFELTIQIDAAATCLRVIIEILSTNDVINILQVGANIGTRYIKGQPCIIQGIIGELKSYDATEVAPTGELLIYSVELPVGYTRLDSFINGKFGRGSNNRSKLDDALGRYDRNWANTSVNDPDKISRTNRGDGTTGDHVGTKLGWQNYVHRHGQSANADDSSSGSIVAAQAGRNSGYTIYNDYSGGNQANPIDRNILKTIRWC